MISIIQRVTTATVTVCDQEIGRIQRGIMALVAVEKQDREQDAQRLLQRMLNYRIFPDKSGRMNLSLRDIDGGLLLVPQFTLAADTNKGNSPSFATAAPPEQGEKLFAYLIEQAKINYAHVECGLFSADMQVMLINDGPVTFTLKTAKQSALHHPDSSLTR